MSSAMSPKKSRKTELHQRIYKNAAEGSITTYFVVENKTASKLDDAFASRKISNLSRLATTTDTLNQNKRYNVYSAKTGAGIDANSGLDLDYVIGIPSLGICGTVTSLSYLFACELKNIYNLDEMQLRQAKMILSVALSKLIESQQHSNVEHILITKETHFEEAGSSELRYSEVLYNARFESDRMDIDAFYADLYAFYQNAHEMINSNYVLP